AFPLSVSGPCWSGAAVRLSLSGLSDSSRSDFQSVAGLNSFPIFVGGGLPFGCSDFIRSVSPI
ncbi:hypothetical protein, partial [Streptomyces sp. NPDC059788]|uniref:hypothetical protein n=1 Tax=Streptomyces sp. NPDC059788 TaxID=3346948 RepID=UPI003661D243